MDGGECRVRNEQHRHRLHAFGRFSDRIKCDESGRWMKNQGVSPYFHWYHQDTDHFIKGVQVSKAGSRIRELARQRRNGALSRFGSAGGLVVAPLLVSLLLPIAVGIKVLVWISCLVGAVVLYQKGQHLWMRANQADQGAEGEESVAGLLKTLERQGWKIEYNVPLQRWGDADAFLRSPRGNCFVVDTKSNKGGVFFDGSVLKRRFGRQVHEFNNGKDLLRAVKGQAGTLKDLKRVKYVQPILCFTQANLEEIKQDQKLDGVYVVGATKLVSLLKQLDRN